MFTALLKRGFHSHSWSPRFSVALGPGRQSSIVLVWNAFLLTFDWWILFVLCRVKVHIEAMILQHDFAENVPLLKEDIATLLTSMGGNVWLKKNCLRVFYALWEVYLKIVPPHASHASHAQLLTCHAVSAIIVSQVHDLDVTRVPSNYMSFIDNTVHVQVVALSNVCDQKFLTLVHLQSFFRPICCTRFCTWCCWLVTIWTQ